MRVSSTMKIIRPIIDQLFDFQEMKEVCMYLLESNHTGQVIIRVPWLVNGITYSRRKPS